MKIAATSPEQQKTSARRVVGKKSPAEIAAAANRDAEVAPSNQFPTRRTIVVSTSCKRSGVHTQATASAEAQTVLVSWACVEHLLLPGRPAIAISATWRTSNYCTAKDKVA